MSTRYNDGSHYENHQQAAELHDLAAHAHRAAEQHGQEEHLTGHEHSRQALEHSEDAHRHTQAATAGHGIAARQFYRLAGLVPVVHDEILHSHCTKLFDIGPYTQCLRPSNTHASTTRPVAASERARAVLGPPQRVAYGESEYEQLDIFRTTRAGIAKPTYG